MRWLIVLKKLSGYLKIIQYLERMGIWEDMITFLLNNDVNIGRPVCG